MCERVCVSECTYVTDRGNGEGDKRARKRVCVCECMYVTDRGTGEGDKRGGGEGVCE